jgi:hypothetical protein
MRSGTLTTGVIIPSNRVSNFFKHEMCSLRPQNQRYNQTLNGFAPSPKIELHPIQPTQPSTKHTVR